MSNKFIGDIIIKSQRYYETDSGHDEHTCVCGFGDSDNGLVEQDLREYIYDPSEGKILKEYNRIILETPCKNKEFKDA